MKRVVTAGLATFAPLARGHAPLPFTGASSHALYSCLRGGAAAAAVAQGGSSDEWYAPAISTTSTSSTATRSFSTVPPDGSAPAATSEPSTTEYTTLAEPAPGTPFHWAFPVHNLDAAKEFYSTVLGCQEGRSSPKWQDYSLHGHQIVCHWVGDDYRCQDYFNPVDGDEVPVPHSGLALTVSQFHALADRVRTAGIPFIIEPHLRFKGMPGEQYTMFFKDPSGNNLEFKAMVRPENLFAKYNVADK